MTSHSSDSDSPTNPDYEPPALIILGSVVELTQQGIEPTDETLNDGSQA